MSTARAMAAESNDRMNQIRRDELRALLDARDVVLVEALPAPHYEAEHIPGAVNVPDVPDVPDVTAETAAAAAPDKTVPVVTYCAGPSCGRSKAAAAAFLRLGYTDVRVYVGGKADWADAGLPFEGAWALPIRTAG
jgi:rhodanese-related sulfurtransferase